MSQTRAAAKNEGGPLPGSKTVLVELEDGLAWVSMNRPDKRNCISPTLAGEMLACATT
jgi:trans-feruloyl-CoA hydratase/vanillin synthase